ncbi:hypothetical protein EDC04DRAFT_2649354 [Pisolithus marmoratus]|nr:hypothetical protein EDC04DRAFT_2649354 [Pisolithus marmoratus]
MIAHAKPVTQLLEEMRAAYIPTYDVLNLLNGDLTRHWENYDLSAPITTRISSLPQPTSTSGRDSIRDMVQEIKTLQTSLDAVENIDEQLALEEDITGRILWTCHSGLRSAVGHIPTQVLNSILKEDKMYDLADRVKFLEETLKVLRDALAELPTDDQSHLRRIMADAEAGTSKHQLLLDERTRGQRAQGATHEGQATA